MPSITAKKSQLRRASAPKPIPVSPSGDFDGNDGPWSTFAFRIGEPEQVVKLLVGTTTSETWVVDESGCNNLASSCPSNRGYLFNETASTTWEENNLYDIPAESNLGIYASGQYGFDTVGLSWQGSGGPFVNKTVVAGITAPDFYLGVFGLSFRPVNFSTFNNPQRSYLSLLRDAEVIPSLSYGYTAGAKNRLDGAQGSLILGGYDASLFEPVDLSFNMSQVTYRDLVVGVQSISIQAPGQPGQTYSAGYYSFIDGIAPHIWLPLAACEVFEKAFGITHDPTTDLYLVNDTLHSHLLSQNASVSFELTMTVGMGPTVTITLPYSSFDLLATADYPGLKNESRYFPIRRAANESQFTLGRTFLQDAYLTVDYERSNFSIQQRIFDPNAQQNLVAVVPQTISTGNTTNSTSVVTSNAKQHKLNAGAIAGIAIGAAAIILLAFGLWTFWKRKVVEKKPETWSKLSEDTVVWQTKPELDGQLRYELEEHKHEMDNTSRHELGGGICEMEATVSIRGELDASGQPVELPG